MSGENPRLIELRRRVQADPASIAFAQLAEECRRAGANDEAIGIARAGLVFHPGYLSARVTLGRALIELDRFDEAQRELATVIAAAPDNLAANRALAEALQKSGRLAEALAQYRKALELAKYDPELEQQVSTIETGLTPPLPPPPTAPTPVEDLFDFDTLLDQLGGANPVPDHAGSLPRAAVPSQLASVDLRPNDDDPFSVLERQLREAPFTPMVAAPGPEQIAEQHILDDLEEWLAAIRVDRESRRGA